MSTQRNIITAADAGRPEQDEDTGGYREFPITTESVLRWGATLAFLAFAGGFMYVLGAEVGAWLAMFAGVVLMGGPMIALWVHRFRVEGVREDREVGRMGAGAFVSTTTSRDDEQHHGARGGTSLTAGPGRDDGHGGDDDLGEYQDRRARPWRGDEDGNADRY